MDTPVGLLSLVTAAPPYELRQDEIVAAARTLFQDRFPEFERMAPVFETAGVRTRQFVQPVEWFFEPRRRRSKPRPSGVRPRRSLHARTHDDERDRELSLHPHRRPSRSSR